MATNNFFKNLSSNLNKAFRTDFGRGKPLPRRGMFAFANTVVNKKQQRQFVLNSATLGKLANTDPVTWAIRRTIKGFISGIPWDIVPDTQPVEVELARWEDTIISYINPYGFDLPDFKSKMVDKELYGEVRFKVETILDDTSITDAEKRDRIRWLFNIMTRKVREIAESHKYQVKKFFEHPNNTDSSFRMLLELVLDDILIYDAGAIVKNYNYYGELAELYTLPGHEVKIYRNEDGTMPEPPEAAYAWEEKGVLRAEFANDELLYIMQNPQHSGYGLSPLEVASYIITASLYADEYNIDYFRHSNVPPGVLNLGAEVTEDQRLLFQKLWEEEVQGKGGLHKIVFASGSDKMQFIPMRTQTNRDMQMMEYLKWTTAIKCACYGLSPQDIGFVLDFHRTSAEVQEKLSKTRGVNNLLNLLQSFFNEEIVKAEFAFNDVKFAWEADEDKNSIQQAQIDKIDLDSGVISINERRDIRGMRPVEGGDEYMIKGGAGMVPVSDLAKLNEQRLEQPVQPGTFGMQPPVDGSQLPANGENPTKEKPGPEAEQNVQGDPGRPTLDEQKESSIKVSVSRKKVVSVQHELLNKTIETLKKQGINAVLKIGFEDEKK